MKSNQVSVLVVLLLCLVMGGFLYVVDRSSDDEKGWSPSELYSELGARSYEGSSFSDVTFSGGASSDGVAVSMRNGSFSLRTRVRHASLPVAAPQASSLSLSGSTSTSSSGSLIGHMTSSAEYHSFGGGHSGNMGSAMTGMTNSGNVAASFAYSSPSYGVANSGLSSYSPITLSSGTDGTQIMSAEQALISTSSSASGLFCSALQNTYGTASYGDYVGISGGQPSGVRGRQNVGSGSSNNPNGWLAWLANYARGLYGYNDEGTNSYGFDYYQLQEAYAKWLAEWMSDTGLTEDKAPSFDDFLNWFYENEFTYNWTDGTGDSATLHWVPLGNVLPLLILALLYCAYVAIRRRKSFAE
jgi:hypothetical protein